jgi:hypothetical protein
MSETPKQKFTRLARQLLERDGKDVLLLDVFGIWDADTYTRVLQLGGGALSLSLNVRGELNATIPGNLEGLKPDFRMSICSDTYDEYVAHQVDDWTPKLEALLILERLANL